MQINKDKLNESIIAGDFNSNAIWDEWDKSWNHSVVVKEFKEIGIESFYHKFTGELHRQETTPTLHFQKKSTRTYHFVYIFVTEKFTDKIIKFEVGQLDKIKRPYADYV